MKTRYVFYLFVALLLNLVLIWTTGCGGNETVSPIGTYTPSPLTLTMTENYIFVRKWGSYGSTGDGQFNRPHKIAADSNGNIYVSDTNNNRIQKFTNTGTFITKWGSAGTSEGGLFNSPFDIAADSSGNIYVADTYNNRIQVFSLF